MTTPFPDVCLACFPRARLADLAEIRCVPGVRVALAGDRAWVRFEAGDERVVRRVLPIAGVRLYRRRDGCWFPHGQFLPAFEVPENLDGQPLHQVLTPAPVQPVTAAQPVLRPVPLALVPDDRPRPTTAMTCDLADLAAWADTVPSVRLATLRAAYHQGRVLLLGQRLPLLASGERFWGVRVLVPVGQRLEPALPEGALGAALGLLADDFILVGWVESSRPTGHDVFSPGGSRRLDPPYEDQPSSTNTYIRVARAEIVTSAVLQPLTRAGLRLAVREVVR
jgi:MoxR-vWA-beta-propeller ternary system domain bpX2